MTTPSLFTATPIDPSLSLSENQFPAGGRQHPDIQELLKRAADGESADPSESKSSLLETVDLENFRQQILILPGWRDSGPRHWQTEWERKYGLTKIQQRDWENPNCEEWIEKIAEYVEQCPSAVIIAHSLGCIAVVHAIQRGLIKPTAVVLVAPADMDNNIHKVTATGFSPIPTDPLPCPSLVIASDNDKYMTADRSRELATLWGSEFKLLENHGHINAESDIGEWRAGQAMVLQFLRKLKQQ